MVLLRMAGILFSLLKNMLISFSSGIWVVEIWNFIKSLCYQVLCWLIWIIHSGIRLWFEYCWGFLGFLFLPLIWPIFLLIQLIFGMSFSSSTLNQKRNSFQSFHSRRGQQLDNYNFFSYWYLSNCNFKVIDQKYGTFHSTYAAYSWWASVLLQNILFLVTSTKRD